MKIKHSVETDDREAGELYNMVTGLCLAIYPTVEEQDMAIIAGQHAFKQELDKLILKAFDVGFKIGDNTANIKDAAMYDA
jgi:hypothetical protein